MRGMDAKTGTWLDGQEHLMQSIRLILSTPINTRVMLPEFGSDVPNLISKPMTAANRLRLYAAATEAITRWEPRITVRKVEVTGESDNGEITLTVEGTYDGEPFSLPIVNVGVVMRHDSFWIKDLTIVVPADGDLIPVSKQQTDGSYGPDEAITIQSLLAMVQNVTFQIGTLPDDQNPAEGDLFVFEKAGTMYKGTLSELLALMSPDASDEVEAMLDVMAQGRKLSLTMDNDNQPASNRQGTVTVGNTPGNTPGGNTFGAANAVSMYLSDAADQALWLSADAGDVALLSDGSQYLVFRIAGANRQSDVNNTNPNDNVLYLWFNGADILYQHGINAYGDNWDETANGTTLYLVKQMLDADGTNITPEFRAAFSKPIERMEFLKFKESSGNVGGSSNTDQTLSLDGTTPTGVRYGSGSAVNISGTANAGTFTILKAGIYMISVSASIDAGATDRPQPYFQIQKNSDSSVIGQTPSKYIRFASNTNLRYHETGLLVVDSDNTVCKFVARHDRIANNIHPTYTVDAGAILSFTRFL